MSNRINIAYEYIVDLNDGVRPTKAVEVNKIQITGVTSDGIVWGRHKNASLLVGEPAFKINFECLRLDNNKAYFISTVANKRQVLKTINYELKKIHHNIGLLINEQISTINPNVVATNAE